MPRRIFDRLILNCCVLGIWASVAYPFQPTHGRILDMAREAKRRGVPEIKLPETLGHNYVLVTSLEDALRNEVPLLVQIDQKKSSVTPDGDHINTWYQAHIVENLTHARLPDFVSPDAPSAPPVPWGAIPSESVVIRNSGGTVTMEGVTVKTDESPAVLELGKQYLLFLRFWDNRDGSLTRVGTLDMGQGAVFAVDERTGVFTAADKQQTHPLTRDLLRRTNGVLSKLRDILPKKPTQ